MQFVGVAWIGADDEFQGFVDRYGLTFPQLSDDGGKIYDRFGIPAQPAFVVVGADGSVETLLGAVDEDTLDGILRTAAAA